MFHSNDRDAIIPSYGRALIADLDRLLAGIPHKDVAVQWDAAIETVSAEFAPHALDHISAGLSALLDHVPHDIPTGAHLCYGDAGHRHLIEPESLASQVRLANAVAQHTERRVDWLSFTVPQDRADEAFFAPIADLLTSPETELYFALVPYHPAGRRRHRRPGRADRPPPPGRPRPLGHLHRVRHGPRRAHRRPPADRHAPGDPRPVRHGRMRAETQVAERIPARSPQHRTRSAHRPLRTWPDDGTTLCGDTPVGSTV
jgi:hypothetical protein